MSEHDEPDEGRLEDLFVADLLFGLNDDERAELEAGMERSGADLQSLADLIGALDADYSRSKRAHLPPQLRDAIRLQATAELRTFRGIPARPISTRSGRWFALAAALLLAVAGFYAASRMPGADAASKRAQLIASAADVVVLDWAAGPTPVAGAAGDVAWSSSRQRGFMRFRGLPKNDPAIEQYQLWIFDRNQDEKTPVDGGVFDVSADGEVVVPINAKLQVKEPYLFAVTVEKPGGVVVSSRARLPLLAAVKR